MTGGEGFERRSFLAGLGLGALACRSHVAPRSANPTQGASSATRRLAELEKETRGHIGVAAWDLASGVRFGYREHERFLFCSTCKFPIAGAVLKRVDQGQEQLERRIAYDASALLENCPITSEHVAEGSMSVSALCEATITTSDNAAGNLLLASVGGPAGLTNFLRSLGDSVSRLDRNEPDLNIYAPGDERDTTSPAAMLHTAHALLVSDQVLSASSRQLLGEWLARASTGLRRLRSAFPTTFHSGDKTGTGDNGATNDIAIGWRAAGKPVLITAYSFGLPEDLDARSDVIGRVGRIAIDALNVRS